MAIKCGNCKEYHESVSEVRSCSGVPQRVAPEATGWQETHPDEATVMDNLSGLKSVVNKPSDRQVTYVMDLLRTQTWPDEFTEEDIRGMERRQVSELIDGLRKAPTKGAKGPKPADKKGEWNDIPAGRYAIAFRSGTGPKPEWRFFQVDKGKKNWTGITFVKQLIGAPGAYREQRLPKELASKMLGMIREETPRLASINYGKESKTCGVCSSPLSNQESLDYGIGPICRAKMEW